MTTRAEALREHALVVELQRNAAHSSRYIARRQQEIAASRSGAESPATKGMPRGSQVQPRI